MTDRLDHSLSSSRRSDFGSIHLAIAVLAGVAAFLIVMATLNWEFHHCFAMPFQDDMYDRLRLYKSATSLGSLFNYLIAPHNEHRILTTRLIAMFDERLLWGREYAQLIATHLLQIASACLAYYAISPRPPDRWSVPEKILAATCLALLFVSPSFLYTLIVPFQVQHAIMEFLCVVACLIVGRASTDPSEAITSIRKTLLALIALAFVCTFTLGSAPVILIAAAAMSIVLRWGLLWVLIIAGFAGAHTIAVLLTTQFVGSPTHDILAIFKFTVIYLGAPLLRLDAWPAPIATWSSSPVLAAAFGSIVLITGVVFGVARLMRPGLGGRTAAFGLMLVVIVVVTGLAAGISRAQFGFLEAGNKKYASFAALGFVGVLAIACGYFRQTAKGSSWAQSATFFVILALLLPASVVGYGRETRLWQRLIERNWEAASAVFSKVGRIDILRELYGQEVGLVEYVGFVEPRDRSIFSYFAFRWGDDISAFLAGRREVPCRSEVSSFDPLPVVDFVNVFGVTGQPMSMTGWTWMTEDEAPPSFVIALDGSNRVIGVAAVTRTSERIEQWLGQKFDQSVSWFGFARQIDASPATFLALSISGRAYCRLGHSGNAR